MGNVLGIIAEYNPFHLGHAYHLENARAQCSAELTVVCLSGPFVQRGDPALLSPAARAEMALRAGADLVIELSCLFACREADYFARGGVSLLKALGCTHLAFGAECADLQLLQRAAAIIDREPEDYTALMKKGLESGLSFAAAQGRALQNCLGQDFNAPNNALALSYLSALETFPMKPVLIPRRGDYHDPHAPQADALPSATAVRHALAKEDWQAVAAMCPPHALAILRRETEAHRICFPQALDQALGLTLMNASLESLEQLPGAGEGLAMRLHRLSRDYTSRAGLLEALKTRRYTHARLSRLLTHALLGVDAPFCRAHPLPAYARVLGFRPAARPLLSRAQEGTLPLINKAARWDDTDPLFRLDMRAWDLWALAAGQPLGMGWRQSPVILP